MRGGGPPQSARGGEAREKGDCEQEGGCDRQERRAPIKGNKWEQGREWAGTGGSKGGGCRGGKEEGVEEDEVDGEKLLCVASGCA